MNSNAGSWNGRCCERTTTTASGGKTVNGWHGWHEKVSAKRAALSRMGEVVAENKRLTWRLEDQKQRMVWLEAELQNALVTKDHLQLE